MFKKHFQLIEFKNHNACNAPQILISGTLDRHLQHLNIDFSVQGDLNSIRFPAYNVNSQRSHELWKHTCFELFFVRKNDTQYYECNFSPSSDWAYYRFIDYRDPHPASIDQPIYTEFIFENCHTAYFKVAIPLFGNFQRDPLQIGISAVIENTRQEYFYYALTHCNDKPDFHNRDSFIMHVPAIEETSS